MKGIIITEFLAFIEQTHGAEFADDVVHRSGLASSAAYTAVGTYDFSELQCLLSAYCKMSGDSAPSALRSYGRFLARSFQQKYSSMYAMSPDLLHFISRIDGHIHVEVKKLYPDAQLPKFAVLEQSSNSMLLGYSSCRPLADLAMGLIEGSAEYFDQPVRVTCAMLQPDRQSAIRIEVGTVPVL